MCEGLTRASPSGCSRGEGGGCWCGVGACSPALTPSPWCVSPRVGVSMLPFPSLWVLSFPCLRAMVFALPLAVGAQFPLPSGYGVRFSPRCGCISVSLAFGFGVALPLAAGVLSPPGCFCVSLTFGLFLCLLFPSRGCPLLFLSLLFSSSAGRSRGRASAPASSGCSALFLELSFHSRQHLAFPSENRPRTSRVASSRGGRGLCRFATLTTRPPARFPLPPPAGWP